MPERKIEYRRLDAVLPAEVNPKGHNLPLIRESIEARGFVDALIEDQRTGRLVGGHGRLIVLKQMQEEAQDAPEGIRPDPADGEWMVPVQVGWASRSDAEARAVLVSLNRATELGGWIESDLGPFLTGLHADDELAGTGFNEHDLHGFGGEAPEGGFGGEGGGERQPKRWICPSCGFSWSE